MKLMQIIPAVFVVVIISGFIWFYFESSKEPMLNDIHTHADFKVYLNGEEYDFNQTKYMTTENVTISPFMHLHDNNGDVVHQHMSTVTFSEFFYTLKMDLTDSCFTLDNGTSYCTDSEKNLRMFVNGKEVFELLNYEFNDLDRILITYGTDDESIIKEQIESVTDKACIESALCPERGEPSDYKTCTSDDGCKA